MHEAAPVLLAAGPSAPVVIHEGGQGTITLVIAVVGLALAMASLGWQAATFFLSGPRVRVYLREGLQGTGGAMLAPISSYTEEGLAAVHRMGYTDPIVAVEAVNHGRLPATVRNWSVVFGNEASYSNPTDPLNPSLPHRLEPGESATWYAPLDHLEQLQGAFADQSDRVATVRAVVDLANKKKIRSREKLLVRSAEPS